MEHFEEHFKHLPEYRVFACRQCRFCPVPQQLLTHLNAYHSLIPVLIRHQIVEYVRQLPDVAWQLQDVRYPAREQPRIPELSIYYNSFLCLGQNKDATPCQRIYDRISAIQRHCKQDHGWVNEQTRGGNARGKHPETPNRMWESGQSYQEFFRYAQWRRRFVVEKNAHTPTTTANQVDDIVQRGEDMLAQHLAAVQEYRKQQTMESADHRYNANVWLKRAGWTDHLSMYKPHELEVMIVKPQKAPITADEGNSVPSTGMDTTAASADEERNESENMLWSACQATVRMIRRAQLACHPRVTGYHALEYVNRRETGHHTNEKPFYGQQMVKTIRKYRRHWTRILCYIWRTHDQQDPKPPYRLTTHQRQCWRQFREAIESSYRRPQQRGRQRELGDACLAWWISLLDHPLDDHHYDNAMVSGSAVLGWNPNDGDKGVWRSPRDYPPVLSGIVSVARMLVVFQAHRLREREIAEMRQAGEDEDTIREQAPSHFSLVQGMVHRFMTLTEFGGQPTPFNWWLRLRTFGMQIRMNMPEEGMISWRRDEIQCGSVRFTMAQLRSMMHGLVSRLRRILCEDLLMLKAVPRKGKRWNDLEGMPPLDLSVLHDNPSNFQDEWSFLKDPRNSFSVDGQAWLYGRVLREAGLRYRFIEATSKGDGSLRWRPRAVQKLFAVATGWKRDLLVAVHMSGGGVARGSEIITIRHRNDRTSNGRGIFLSDGMVDLVTMYHKGEGHTSRPKIIHRFPPEEVGELLVYYLWLVQPFLEIMQMYCHNQKTFGPWLWEPKPHEGAGDDEDDE
jgi:hypothetical protein